MRSKLREPLMDHPLVEWLATSTGAQAAQWRRQVSPEEIAGAVTFLPKCCTARRWALPFRSRSGSRSAAHAVQEAVLGRCWRTRGGSRGISASPVADHQAGLRARSQRAAVALTMFEAFLRNVMACRPPARLREAVRSCA